MPPWADLSLAAFMLGIAGTPHCVAMCGGFALATNLKQNGDARPRYLRVAKQHAGRVAGYATMGAIAGTVGYTVSGLSLPGGMIASKVITGAMIAVVIAQLLGFNAPSNALERVFRRVFTPVSALLGRGPAFRSGYAWGFLPCGLSYSACAFAGISGTPWAGAIVMAVFGISTIPATATVSLIGPKLLPLAKSKALRYSAAAMLTAMLLMRIVGGSH